MNKRMIWNFEFHTENPLSLEALEQEAPEKIRWEIRYFWPENRIITLKRLNEAFLNLSHYQIKFKQDIYYLLPHRDYNIKIRQDNLTYKPLLKKSSLALGFGKKIKLTEGKNILAGTDNVSVYALINEIEQTGRKVEVTKETLIHRFSALSKTKLELTKLNIHQQTYFSVSIESRSLPIAEHLAKHLLDHQNSCDYVTFLKRLNIHD